MNFVCFFSGIKLVSRYNSYVGKKCGNSLNSWFHKCLYANCYIHCVILSDNYNKSNNVKSNNVNPGKPKSDVSYKPINMHAVCVMCIYIRITSVFDWKFGIEQFSANDKTNTIFISKHCIVPFSV